MGEEAESPLGEASAADWDRLIEQVNPASVLVVLRCWMGPSAERWHAAEDLWQETLLHAWRDRHRLEWRGPRAFRSWLLTIARRRFSDFARNASALKRGADRARVGPSTSGDSVYAGPVQETTPDRVLTDRERAEILRRALDEVPEEQREVVRLRLFEDRSMAEVAQQLGLGVEAVRYRFRLGSEAYRDGLRRARASPSRWSHSG